MSSEIIDLATRCIRCGFCLEACPTFTETGLETQSPRGRIYLARSAEEGSVSWGDIRESLDTCLGCRACETACPSGVEYGRLLEHARSQGAAPDPEFGRTLNWMTEPRLLALASRLGALLPGGRAPNPLGPGDVAVPRPQPRDAWPPFDAPPSRRGSIGLLTGCAMGVLFARAHEASARLLARLGWRVRPVEGCCGALHAHNGFLDEGRRRAAGLDSRLPIVTDSAGCGSWLEEERDGHVEDISEVLLAGGLGSLLAAQSPLRLRIAYHDACHLAHGQGIRSGPRALLESVPGVTLVPLAESDTCCGSAGIYNLTRPEMARRLLKRKWSHVERSGADIVVAGNPGCLAWLDVAAREHGSAIGVYHTVEVLEAAFSGWPPPE